VRIETSVVVFFISRSKICMEKKTTREKDFKKFVSKRFFCFCFFLS